MQSKHCVRTYDKAYIKSVLTHPSIWPNIKGKHDIEPEEFSPPMSEEYIYLKCDGGLFILHPYQDGLEIHANMIERGQKAIDACSETIEYAKNIGVRVLYASIPSRFPNVLAFAELMGFKEYDFSEDNHHLRRELV